MLRILLGGLILGQPFLFMLVPEVLHESYWFLIYFIVVMAMFWLVGRIVFARELKALRRAENRLRFRSFYSQMAQRHSTSGLALGFAGSLLFVAAGVWMLSVGANFAVAISSVVFFGLCAVAWGYSLYLKLKSDESPKQPDEQKRA